MGIGFAGFVGDGMGWASRTFGFGGVGGQRREKCEPEFVDSFSGVDDDIYDMKSGE